MGFFFGGEDRKQKANQEIEKDEWDEIIENLMGYNAIKTVILGTYEGLFISSSGYNEQEEKLLAYSIEYLKSGEILDLGEIQEMVLKFKDNDIIILRIGYVIIIMKTAPNVEELVRLRLKNIMDKYIDIFNSFNNAVNIIIK